MKNNKRKMCSECPFRKNSMPGYLGPHTPEGLLKIVHGEGGFACHMDIDKVKYGGKDFSKLEQCAGAILHGIKSGKSFRHPQLQAQQKALKGSTELNNTLGLREFMEHHRDSPEAKKFQKFKEEKGLNEENKIEFNCSDCGKDFKTENDPLEIHTCPDCGSMKVSEVE